MPQFFVATYLCNVFKLACHSFHSQLLLKHGNYCYDGACHKFIILLCGKSLLTLQQRLSLLVCVCAYVQPSRSITQHLILYARGNKFSNLPLPSKSNVEQQKQQQPCERLVQHKNRSSHIVLHAAIYGTNKSDVVGQTV